MIALSLPARGRAPDATAPTSAATTAPAGWKDVDVAEFEKLIRAGGHILLDVRTPREFRRSRIAGAVNIDFNADDFGKRIDELDRKRPVLVYCRTGRRSAEACDLLVEKGFARVFHLEGGIVAWEDAGKPVETDEP